METEKYASVIQLAGKISDGFLALNEEYQLLVDQQRQLESKLSWTKQQYLELLKKSTPESVPQDHLTFLQDLEQVTYDQHTLSPSWLDQLARSEDVQRRARSSAIRLAGRASLKFKKLPQYGAAKSIQGVKIWNGPSADVDETSNPVASKSHLESLPRLEKDFTVPGTPSRLGCPFARRSSGSGRQSPLATPRSSLSRLSAHARRSHRQSFNDPIRAEICGNDPVSASASVEESAPVCPIRFLDQHSPEEVAKYFENHKHEIPRSHEVCVKRFQSNADSIRQLDAKYGNLVSMIQGLGMKHQPWLPKDPDELEEEHMDEGGSTEKVKKWAKAVSASLQDDEANGRSASLRNVPDEHRMPHFDRPLKEIRVGESPSRPWGIAIPAKYTESGSASCVKSAATASPPSKTKTAGLDPKTPANLNKCPFDHARNQKEPAFDGPPTQTVGQDTSTNPQKETRHPETFAPYESDKTRAIPSSPPQMVFNGPVFFGYPFDQIMTFLQQSNMDRKV